MQQDLGERYATYGTYVTDGKAYQYSSKWILPLIFAAALSAWKPRRSRISITPVGLGYSRTPVSLFFCGTPIIAGLPHRNTCVLAGSSVSPMVASSCPLVIRS